MNHVMTFESHFDRDTMELVEDLFQEVYDKWKIKKIPSKQVASDFMTRVEDDSIYYHIDYSFNGVVFRIYQNRLIDIHQTQKDFKDLVRECIKILDRIKKYNLNYDIKFDANVIQNPYTFSPMNSFILKLQSKF